MKESTFGFKIFVRDILSSKQIPPTQNEFPFSLQGFEPLKYWTANIMEEVSW